MSGRNFPHRGDIYWGNLDPSIGVEIKKKRPCLIVSNDLGNEVSNIVMIAPITSKIKKVYSYEVQVELEKKLGKVMLNQCRAIDKSRLGQKMGELDFNDMKLVDNALKIAFGLS